MYSKQACNANDTQKCLPEGPRIEKKCRQQPYNGWQWMSPCLRGTSWRAERWVARSVGFILLHFTQFLGTFGWLVVIFVLGVVFVWCVLKNRQSFLLYHSSTVRWPTIELVRLPRKKKCFCFCVVVFWCVCVSMFFRVCVFAFVFLQVVFLFACLCVFVLFVAKNCLV